MATTPREPTSTLPQPARLTSVTAPSPFHKPVSGSPVSSPTSQETLKPTIAPGLKSYMATKVELSGNAAMEENRRHEEELKRQKALMTTPNPTKTVFMTGPSEGVSRPSDAPPQAAQTVATSRAEDTTMALSAQDSPQVVAEPMEIDEQENGPVMTSSSERTLPNSGTTDSISRSSSKKRPASPTASKNDERSNKSYTYPPPPEHEPVHVARNMSLPNAGTKSPSVKKHRCPHCETEFTRHHNLKSHLLTHSQEKPYPCEQCNQRFRRLHDLKRHLKLHTGERPHECNICKRKFARGDALARHNKGPGGCAGRRESGAGDDDFSDLRADDDMDEAYAAGEDYDGVENDKDLDDRQRRRSEPNKRNGRDSGRTNSTTSDFRHSGTYPPVATALVASRGGDMLPPGSSATSQPREASSQHLSPHPHGAPSFSSVHYNGPSSMYSQSGMTESPKPLSPGNTDPHRRNSDVRPRSPSLATKLQHQHLPRGSGSGTPPINLPPPVSSDRQLPSISGIDPRFGSSSAGGRPPAISTQLGSGSSGPPSASSQHQSSGGSTRDIYGSGLPPQGSWQDEARMKEYVRGVEMRLAEEMTARAAERDERDKIIRSQIDELNALRSQVAHLEGRQDSNQQHRRSH